MFHLDLPTSLYAVDTTTGETEFRCISHAEHRLPERLRFEHKFETQIRAAVCDRYGANIRVEKKFQSQTSSLCGLVFKCRVHKISGAVKHTLNLVDSAVSGLIHTALAVSAAGSVGKLQSILQSIFDQDLEIVFDTPPLHCQQHRDQVLNLFCPCDTNSLGSFRNAQRQFVLRRMCNSDISQSKIIHFCRYGCCQSPEETKTVFLQQVTWALIGKKAPILNKKSWTGADLSFQWQGMLQSFWNLLERVICTYTGGPQYMPRSDGVQNADMGEEEGVVVDLVEENQELVQAGLCAGNEVNWAEVNKQYAKKAAAFCTSVSFKEILAVCALVLKPAMSLLTLQLEMAGQEWEKRQQYEAFLGHKRQYQVVETALGTNLADCFLRVLELLFDEPAAVPLSCYVRRARCLLFRLSSAMVSSLHFTMRRYENGFPWQLFRLLSDKSKAAAVYGQPGCLHDNLATTFFEKFPSPESGISEKGLALLELVASIVDVDISSVEASHASTREYSMSRSRGHIPSLDVVSAQTIFRFIRKKYEVYSNPNMKEETQNTEVGGAAADSSTKTRKKRNVGAWNAFLHKRLNKRAITKQLCKDLAEEYRNLSHDEWIEYYELGLAFSLKAAKSVGDHATALALVPANANLHSLVASPTLTMCDYDEFLKVQLAMRKEEASKRKKFQEDMIRSLKSVEGNQQLLSSLHQSSGSGVASSVQPIASSSFVQHFTWIPKAFDFAEASTASTHSEVE